MHSNTLQYIRIHSNTFKYLQIYSTKTEHVQTYSNAFNNIQIHSKALLWAVVAGIDLPISVESDIKARSIILYQSWEAVRTVIAVITVWGDGRRQSLQSLQLLLFDGARKQLCWSTGHAPHPPALPAGRPANRPAVGRLVGNILYIIYYKIWYVI